MEPKEMPASKVTETPKAFLPKLSEPWVPPIGTFSSLILEFPLENLAVRIRRKRPNDLASSVIIIEVVCPSPTTYLASSGSTPRSVRRL